MTIEHWVLAVTVFLSGLGSGLLGMLCTIMRPMQAAMDRPEFRNWMGSFLRYAGKPLGKVYNYAWSAGTTLAAVVALVLLFDDPASPSFVLTAIALGIWIVGILIVSNVWKTPTYKVILALDPEALPADWETVRQRYFTINWIQFARPGRRSPCSLWRDLPVTAPPGVDPCDPQAIQVTVREPAPDRIVSPGKFCVSRPALRQEDPQVDLAGDPVPHLFWARPHAAGVPIDPATVLPNLSLLRPDLKRVEHRAGQSGRRSR